MDALEDERRTAASARVGTVLHGKWRLDRLLGAGGMATVFAATHRNGMRAAVKILHPELSLVGEARKRFVNEGYAANRIDHPGAIKVIDDDVDDQGSAFLVMELLEGETLEERRERNGGRLGPREVLELADQALDVLAAAHDKGVIHRDLKPENLFLTREGRLKVVDFGLARLQELSGDARLTASNGGIMGTPAFLPPEQARGRWADIDGRTDLWALGATMFTLLSGRCVHEAETVNEALVAAITRPAPRLSQVVAGAPPGLSAVIDKALAMDPRDRYQDARAMQEAVRRALATAPGQALSAALPAAFPLAATQVAAHSTPTTESADAATLRRPDLGRRIRLLVVAAGGVVLLAGAAILLSRGPPPAGRTAPEGPPEVPTASASPLPGVTVSPGALPPATSASTSTAPVPRGKGPPPRASSSAKRESAPTADDLLDRRN